MWIVVLVSMLYGEIFTIKTMDEWNNVLIENNCLSGLFHKTRVKALSHKLRILNPYLVYPSVPVEFERTVLPKKFRIMSLTAFAAYILFVTE